MALSVYIDRHTEITSTSTEADAMLIIKSSNPYESPKHLIELEGVISVCQPIFKAKNAFMIDEWVNRNLRDSEYPSEQVHDIQFSTLMQLKERCERAIVHKEELPTLFPSEVPYENREARIAEIVELYSTLVREEIYVTEFMGNPRNRNLSVKYSYTGGW